MEPKFGSEFQFSIITFKFQSREISGMSSTVTDILERFKRHYTLGQDFFLLLVDPIRKKSAVHRRLSVV